MTFASGPAECHKGHSGNGKDFAHMRFEGTADYVATDDLKTAVNAAIVLERPLLVKGEPGTGKTVLALEIADASGSARLTTPPTAGPYPWFVEDIQYGDWYIDRARATRIVRDAVPGSIGPIRVRAHAAPEYASGMTWSHRSWRAPRTVATIFSAPRSTRSRAASTRLITMARSMATTSATKSSIPR